MRWARTVFGGGRHGGLPLRGVLIAVAMLCVGAEAPRGGRVGWARLITPNPDWEIHSDQDPKLAKFIRGETSLNIDPTWYTVDPHDLNRLCAYPYLYTKDLTRLKAEAVQGNMREYLERGGFVFVDPCIARIGARAAANFATEHAKWFAKLWPGCEMRLLPADHELFRCYFTVGVDDIYTTDMIQRGATRPPHLEVYGIFQGERLIAVISVVGLECGWPQTPQRAPGCMKLIVNSYIYAMTR